LLRKLCHSFRPTMMCNYLFDLFFFLSNKIWSDKWCCMFILSICGRSLWFFKYQKWIQSFDKHFSWILLCRYYLVYIKAILPNVNAFWSRENSRSFRYSVGLDATSEQHIVVRRLLRSRLILLLCCYSHSMVTLRILMDRTEEKKKKYQQGYFLFFLLLLLLIDRSL